MPDDRDTLKKRLPPAGVKAQIAPEFIADDLTGKYQGEELAEMRSKRPTDKRLARLEEKHDALDEKVDGLAVAVSGMAGEMKSIPRLTQLLEDELKARRADGHLVLKQTLEVTEHEAKSRIDNRSFSLKARWKVVLQVVGALTSAGVIGAIISALATGHC